MNNHPEYTSDSARKRTSRLARRLAFFIIITSTIITVITTAIQLRFDYLQEIKSVSISFNDIEQSHAPAITSSLWNYDLRLAQVQINGIHSLSEIEFVELIITDSLDTKKLIAGEQKSSNVISSE
ncbi:MAG: hypothetical protein GY808_17435, partial [Gammaproteobacteria bacterium]|nr:hypothetical protein [Gammaproteobacteria bacterium]